MFHRFVMLIRRFVLAVQHVRSGGRTTRVRAVRRAAAPPRRCPECRQSVQHSPDWRDHIHDAPEWRDRIRDY